MKQIYFKVTSHNVILLESIHKLNPVAFKLLLKIYFFFFFLTLTKVASLLGGQDLADHECLNIAFVHQPFLSELHYSGKIN